MFKPRIRVRNTNTYAYNSCYNGIVSGAVYLEIIIASGSTTGYYKPQPVAKRFPRTK